MDFPQQFGLMMASASPGATSRSTSSTAHQPSSAAVLEAPQGVMHHRSSQEAKMAFFGALVAVQTDVYAVRHDRNGASSPLVEGPRAPPTSGSSATWAARSPITRLSRRSG